MRIFAIRDEMDRTHKDLGFLFYYEKEKAFIIELSSGIDVWEAPLLLSSFVKKGVFTIDRKWSRIWVQQRIIPAERQNLGQILKENKLKTYDEFRLLMLANGRCEQDDCYLEEIPKEELPVSIRKRMQKNIKAAVPLSNQHVLVFFQNGRTKRFDAGNVYDRLCAYYKKLNAEQLFRTVSVSAGGVGMNWGSEVYVCRDEAYREGETVPVSLEELKSFVASSVVNSKEAAEILHCSRQNIDDLVKRGRLVPLKKSEKGMLFLKDEILARTWD